MSRFLTMQTCDEREREGGREGEMEGGGKEGEREGGRREGGREDGCCKL